MDVPVCLDSLCDEVIQLIIYELNDPGPLSLASKRLYSLSEDPYTRAHYFLRRYGRIQAMFYALGHGKLLTERVLDILISSGAHVSRYLIQVAFHHYFNAQSHFIKSPWTRSIPLDTFAYFLKLAAARYGDIPRGKGDDDGSIFASFLKESRFPAHARRIEWEAIRDILEKYHFIPFSSKDPIMVQFPLVLAIEPRLLPYAVANGFHMDTKYRDFVFRKIFEKAHSSSDRVPEDIIRNVTELCRLDPSMFVSRTVAAEVCMEAKTNDVGYSALKQLGKGGKLRFDLASTVEELLKIFLKSRSITSPNIHQILRTLFTDFPSSDPSVRLVMLLTTFICPDPPAPLPDMETIKSRLEELKLTPLTRMDLLNLLIHPCMDKYTHLLLYMRTEFPTSEEGNTGMSPGDITSLMEDVAMRCLELGCKGKMLKRLNDSYPTVLNVIVRTVLGKHQIGLPTNDEELCQLKHRATLCRMPFYKAVECDYFWDGVPDDVPMDVSLDDILPYGPEPDVEDLSQEDLGNIGEDSLTTMIRQDELMPARVRRRLFWTMQINSSHSFDPLTVGRWIKNHFGTRSPVTAVFMTHCILNDNTAMLQYYLSEAVNVHAHVPVTLKHFQLLSRLGRAPNYFLYQDIQNGADFFRSEEDYVSPYDVHARMSSRVKVKIENLLQSPPPPSSTSTTMSGPSSLRGKKRPRRSAASVQSYAVPESDEDEEEEMHIQYERKVTAKTECGLHQWIKALGELLKVEQAKHREKKKRMESEAEPGSKIRVPKNAFFKSLATNLRILKKQDEERRMFNDVDDCEFSGSGDDDYSKRTRSKRRKMNRI